MQRLATAVCVLLLGVHSLRLLTYGELPQRLGKPSLYTVYNKQTEVLVTIVVWYPECQRSPSDLTVCISVGCVSVCLLFLHSLIELHLWSSLYHLQATHLEGQSPLPITCFCVSLVWDLMSLVTSSSFLSLAVYPLRPQPCMFYLLSESYWFLTAFKKGMFQLRKLACMYCNTTLNVLSTLTLAQSWKKPSNMKHIVVVF